MFYCGWEQIVNNRYRDSDNKRSQAVVYTKRVNGNYYVFEAVPDSKAKTLQIISAYKTKAEGVSQVLNMPKSPQLTSETPHAFAPSDNNVSQTKSYVKSVPATVDGRSVTVSGIDRIETNGNRAQMYVKTADGESVALSDVNFGNRETEAIDSNAITSVHTRQNAITGLLKDAVNDEAAGNTSVYYIDAKKPPTYSRRLGYNCPVTYFAPMATFIVYAIPTQMSSQKLRM